jgi:hypothetical protein
MASRYNVPTIQGSDPIQTFQLQQALMRQRQPNDRAAMARALMQQGASTAPVQHWLQGLARATQGIVGGYMSGEEEREGKARDEEMLAGMIGQRDQTRQAETAQLAQAGVPGFQMPMPQPVPGEAQQVPIAPAGGGDVVMPANMPAPPPQPPTQPVDARMISALMSMGAAGNQTAAGAAPAFAFQYQDQMAREREARQEAMERQRLAVSSRETFGQPVVEMVDGQPALVRYGNLGGRQVVPGATPQPETPKPPTLTEMDRKLAMMAENGVPENIARALLSGQHRLVTNDMDGSIRAIDMATGREVWNPDAPRTPVQTEPPPSAPGAAAVPGAGSVPGQTTPNDGVDYPGATGLPGAASRVANTIADMFGGTLPAPERERASQALTNLATRTQMHLQTAIPGRPSNYLMEMIGDLTLKPGEITVGPQRAAERVRQTRQFVEQTVAEMEEVASGAGQRRFSREQIANANLALQSLRPLLADYKALDSAFASRGAPGGAGGATERTAINPRTGQQMIYRGGQWIPKP